MPNIKRLDTVRSLRDAKIWGLVVGHGVIRWPDDDKTYPVYLVQTDDRGSSSLTPAVTVLRQDLTEKMDVV